jgi:quercetin dioxygenase-like cupin family protein
MTFDLNAPSGHVVVARELEPAEVPGHSFRIVADGAGTRGAYSVTEATSPSGATVGWHVHDGAVECFYVFDGWYRLNVSGASHDAGPGDFTLVPRGAPHGFEVLEGEARALVLFAPAGFETIFRRMPEIFGTAGEPGPVWALANQQAATRLLDGPGPGPAALVRPAGPKPTGSAVLADAAATETRLDIELRQDVHVGSAWSPDPSVTAICVLTGRYRFESPDQTLTAGEGEYLALPRTAAAPRAMALAPDSRALLLRCLGG